MKPTASSRNRPRASKGVALTLLVASLLGAAPARTLAQDADRVKTYEESIARGDAAWDAGQFADARAAYEAAYLIHPDPTLLFNIASTYRREGQSEKALDYYENYLRSAPADDQFRAQATETAATLRLELAAQRKVIRPAPPPALHVDKRRGDGGSGLNKKQWIGIATGTVGLSALVYAAIQGNEAAGASDKLDKVQPGQQWTPQLQQQYDDGKTAEKRAIIFSVIGGAAVLGGATLFYLGHRQHQQERRLSVLPVADSGMAGALVFGSF